MTDNKNDHRMPKPSIDVYVHSKALEYQTYSRRIVLIGRFIKRDDNDILNNKNLKASNINKSNNKRTLRARKRARKFKNFEAYVTEISTTA